MTHILAFNFERFLDSEMDNWKSYQAGTSNTDEDQEKYMDIQYFLVNECGIEFDR